MMARRHFLLGCTAAPLAAAAPYLPDCRQDRITFRILRNGSPIGSHVLEFAPTADGFDIVTTVEIRIGLGPITLFRYRLTGTERWRGGVLAGAESVTDHDGTHAWMNCRRENEALFVSGSKGPRYRAPEGALTASHWNAAELEGPWINLEDGALMRPKVDFAGYDRLEGPDGAGLKARHYVLSGEASLDLWYEPDGRWAALAARGQDGSALRYERI